MNVRLRAKVRRCTTHTGSWIATAHAVGTLEMAVVCARSWPEAMQAAYAQLQALDNLLMNEVHESRAARRAAMDRHPAGKTRQEPTA